MDLSNPNENSNNQFYLRQLPPKPPRKSIDEKLSPTKIVLEKNPQQIE